MKSSKTAINTYVYMYEFRSIKELFCLSPKTLPNVFAKAINEVLHVIVVVVITAGLTQLKSRKDHSK